MNLSRLLVFLSVISLHAAEKNQNYNLTKPHTYEEIRRLFGFNEEDLDPSVVCEVNSDGEAECPDCREKISEVFYDPTEGKLGFEMLWEKHSKKCSGKNLSLVTVSAALEGIELSRLLIKRNLSPDCGSSSARLPSSSDELSSPASLSLLSQGGTHFETAGQRAYVTPPFCSEQDSDACHKKSPFSGALAMRRNKSKGKPSGVDLHFEPIKPE